MTTAPTAELLLRLDQPGPRYTSYPTVPVWEAGFDVATWEGALRTLDRPASVYVHVPFCKEQCWFCGCNQVVSRRQAAGDRYLDAVQQQVEALALPTERHPVVRLHLGGGTPTWLDEAQLQRLFDLLHTRFAPVEGAEISVEVDPDVTSDDRLDRLGALGVTRISLGVQSTDPRILSAINRPQRTERVHALMARAREHGMEGLNVDLIYGLPHQTEATFAATLAEVQAMAPDRLAIYSYAHVPWMKRHQQRIDESALPGPVDKVGLFLQARAVLDDAGYVPVGMDHFARPDDELAVASRAGRLHRNFMGYTTLADVPLIGLGVSAISELDGVYAQQQPHLGAWYRAVERQAEPLLARGMTLTPEDRLRKDVIADLMCNFTIHKPAIEARHGVDFDAHFADALAALAPLVDDGLVQLSDERIEVTDLGRLLVRNVAMPFDAHLHRGGRFSRTV